MAKTTRSSDTAAERKRASGEKQSIKSSVSQELLFMQAQLPFNREALVELNAPRAAMMDDAANLGIIKRNFKELHEWDNLLQRSAACLEIGCGRGYVLTELYKRGKGLYLGVEPIPTEAKIARESLAALPSEFTAKTFPITTPKPRMLRGKRVPIWNTTLEKLRVRAGSLTHIYSYHVIEHLENPLLLLQLSYNGLGAGGKLIISCPNVEGAYPQQHFKAWRCNIRAHRWLPGVRTLAAAVEAAGFEVRRIFTYGGYPHPRNLLQKTYNAYYKWRNLGDVLCLMAEKPHI